jgi:hypothetical protein
VLQTGKPVNAKNMVALNPLVLNQDVHHGNKEEENVRNMAEDTDVMNQVVS